MDPSRRRATSPREFGDSSDNAGAIETSSRFHTSKERRNPRLGGGDGGGEQEEASEIDLEIYLSTAASSRQREKKKKKALAHPIRCRQGLLSSSEATPNRHVHRKMHLLPSRARQLCRKAPSEEKTRRQVPFRIGCDGDVVSERRLFFFFSIDGKKNEKKEKARRVPGLCSELVPFPQTTPGARRGPSRHSRWPCQSAQRIKKERLPVETVWQLAAAPTDRQSTRHGACRP